MQPDPSTTSGTSRRQFLRNLGVAAGGAALFGGEDAVRAVSTRERTSVSSELGDDAVAIVHRIGTHGERPLLVQFEGTRKRMRVAGTDFPPKWEFKEGDKVVISQWSQDTTKMARPLVAVSSPARPILDGETVTFGDLSGTATNEHVRAAIESAIADGRKWHGLFVENVLDDSLEAFGMTIS